MSKLPAFQFYPGDWRKDPGVQSLSFHDRGVWFEILCLMHESDRRGVLTLNGSAMPEPALARLLGLDNQILTTTLTTLLTYGVASRDTETGAVMSRRMVRDEEIRQVRKSCGKLGGNPNLVNQIPTTQVKVNPTPSSSSSPSGSKKRERKNFTPPSAAEVGEYATVIGFALDPQDWIDYWAQRDWKYAKGGKMADWKAAVRTYRTIKEKGNQNGINGKRTGGYESTQEKNARRVAEYLGPRKTGDNQSPDNGFLSVLPAGASGHG